MKNKDEMKEAINYAILEAVNLKYTYYDDLEDRDHCEMQFEQTIEHIAINLNVNHLESAEKLNFLLKKLDFNHESTVLEKGITYTSKELEDPKVSVSAAFDKLEDDHGKQIDSLFAAKILTDAKIENKGIKSKL